MRAREQSRSQRDAPVEALEAHVEDVGLRLEDAVPRDRARVDVHVEHVRDDGRVAAELLRRDGRALLEHRDLGAHELLVGHVDLVVVDLELDALRDRLREPSVVLRDHHLDLMDVDDRARVLLVVAPPLLRAAVAVVALPRVARPVDRGVGVATLHPVGPLLREPRAVEVALGPTGRDETMRRRETWLRREMPRNGRDETRRDETRERHTHTHTLRQPPAQVSSSASRWLGTLWQGTRWGRGNDGVKRREEKNRAVSSARTSRRGWRRRGSA